MFARLKSGLLGLLAGVVLVLLLGVSAIFFIPSLSFPFSLPFSQREFTAAHELILREIRPIFTLSTVEYSYKTVFPYDFLPEDPEPGRVVRKQLRGESLDAGEQELFELIELCRRVGIDLDASAHQFVVIKSRVRGGFRLAGTPWASRPASGSGEGAEEQQDSRAGVGSSIVTHPERGIVEITLPPPEITSFVIEDETSEEYRYPDIEVDPREWKLITEYVRERIEERVIEEGILERSRDHGRRLVTRLLKEAGWKEIRFREATASSSPAPADEARDG
jgi:hypothetical protein